MCVNMTPPEINDGSILSIAFLSGANVAWLLGSSRDINQHPVAVSSNLDCKRAIPDGWNLGGVLRVICHLSVDAFLRYSFTFAVLHRLLSWAGRRIEPYGVDFILNKLGFRHARSTIPKWLQRGSMDPLDKVLAVLVERTVQVTREDH